MVRLVVEEGGKRRAFQLGAGILTVGSGSAAKLKLASIDVAEVHLELVIEDDRLEVRPRPGVMPPTLDGVPVTTATEVPPGRALELGGARLWIEVEGAAPPSRAPPPAPAARPAPGRQTLRSKSDQAQEQAIRRERAIEKAGKTGSRSKVQRSRPRIDRGIPGWMLGGGIALVAVIGFFLLKAGVDKSAEGGAGTVRGSIEAAEVQLGVGNFDRAEEKLAGLVPAKLSAGERARVDAIRSEIESRRSTALLAVEHNIGTKWMEVYLKGYERKYLEGAPAKAKVRLFLKRLTEFQRRWPDHPEMEWVHRQRRRFGSSVDLSMPPDYEDLYWEVSRMVAIMPRRYSEAFATIDAYLALEGADRADEARALREQYVAERAEYHIDRLQQARHEVEQKKNYNKSIWWLVNSVAWLGDEAMENEAAQILVDLDKTPQVNLVDHLLGYQDKLPELYAKVLRNPIVGEFARKHDLL
ncbi:MAG: FHA domain-containing protein [Planctomycetota bacterium]